MRKHTRLLFSALEATIIDLKIKRRRDMQMTIKGFSFLFLHDDSHNQAPHIR